MFKPSLLGEKIHTRSIKYRDRQESRLTRSLNKIFQSWAKYTAQKIQELPQLQGKSFLYVSQKQLQNDVQLILDESPYKALMVEALIAYIGATYVKGSKDTSRVFRKLGIDFAFNLDSPEVVRLLEARKQFELSNFAGNITDTTRKKIVTIVASGIENGLSISEIANQITLQGAEGVFSQARAEFIARTEIGRAYGQASFDTANAVQARTGRQILKSWVTAADERVRDTHRQNENDGWIDLNKPFSGTGELHAPSQDFNCRCTLIARDAADV